MSFCLITMAVTHFHYLPDAPTRLNWVAPLINLPCALDDMALLYLTLVSALMPAVIILADLDHNPRGHKYIVLLLAVYLVTSLLLLTTDLIIFYALYELLVILVFFTMYMSTNARGCIEASLFFLGWAALGSVFVGIAVMQLVAIAGTSDLQSIRSYTLTGDEVFMLYTLSFLGFGTKLSL